ncbi:MAG: type IX secretion system sortase PorU [Bacteroidales bacterium]|nr:type IX secretion system sortase PorU [Bacteroidales bacterium]
MIKKFLFFLLTTLSLLSYSQQPFKTNIIGIDWQPSDSLQFDGREILARPYFTNAWYESDLAVIPYYSENIYLYDNNLKPTVNLLNIEVETVELQLLNISDVSKLDTTFVVKTNIKTAREQYILHLLIPALRYNPTKGTVEKLLKFEYELFLEYEENFKQAPAGFTNNSVLASGNWYKVRVSNSGIHRITFANLQAIGLNPSTLNPRNIRIYGNGGGVLSERNADFRHDDLVENPIVVVGEEDGVFNQSDYILLYAEGPLTWKFDQPSGFYKHQSNYYDDYAYLFITADLGAGKRIQTSSQTGIPSEIVTDFLDKQLHEEDIVNLSNTGRTWYGELFDVTLSRDFNFNFPGLITSKTARVETDVAGRNFGPANFQLFIDQQLKRTMNIDPTQVTGYDYAKGASAIVDFNPVNDIVNVNLKFNRSINSARGWLNYISVNAWRNLSFTGPQMIFGNTRSIDQSAVYEYRVANSNNQVSIWDITDPTAAVRVETTLQGNTMTFKADGSSMRNFIAFDNTSFYSVEAVGAVANQNLHSVRDIDYLIITHPNFLDQANRLAAFHRQNSGLEVFVTIPELIYNEFSSGSQDVTAIRDFARMLFSESSPGRKLRYLLMFGDASFDYKDKLTDNTNYVPTFQTLASLNLVSSIATDDYFGYLDFNEGTNDSSLLDIGIGRFPVSTIDQARQMVDKVFRYVARNEVTMSPWRNEITFVADDGDSNQHLRDAEALAGLIGTDYPAFNLNKIYLDAYRQIATPSGQKAPEVNEAINKSMERGTLIMNYSGHGGEVGWTEERILEIADIISWRNREKMPVFITATCEFSRYDDPTRLSAGEMVFLNPDGGAIAMFTTARATYASTNLRLNRAIFNDNIFMRENGEFPRFGDVIRRSKLTGDANDRKFVLLGDPALALHFPPNKVITTHINGNAVEAVPDTLKALDLVTIKGFVADSWNQQINNFTGILYITVYDKANSVSTFGDQSASTTFIVRNSIIYKGAVEVVGGQFEFSFMMPKDISYRFGQGRISYYATDYEIDAQGYFEDFVVGGFSNNVVNDDKGPEIKLYIGDTTFKSGGFTSENPVLLALLSDESGINTTGAGIGHDIVATLTGATERYAILNEYYAAKINKNSEGVVTFPFFNLNPGKHVLTLKVWDILNNSGSASIEFEVIPKNQVTIDELYNYPNPFMDETWFVFRHNQANEIIDVEIKIYNTNGQLMKTLIADNLSSSFLSNPIRWDGRTDSGQRIAKGLYIYRLIVTNKDGVQSEKRSKLINYK